MFKRDIPKGVIQNPSLYRIQRFGTVFCLALTLPTASVRAQDSGPRLPDASIDVSLVFASNNIDRGEDLYTDRARQNNRPYGSHTGASAFQPNIVWNTPVPGLYFDLWMSIALYGRGDRDLDLLWQAGPGLPDLNPLSPAEQRESLANSDGPGFYSEQVGLGRSDQIIQTLAYERETRVGAMGFGLSVEASPNVIGKAPTTTEIFVTYALPFLAQFTLEIWGDINEPAHYYNAGWSDTLEFTDPQSLDYTLSIGYGSYDRVQGIQDVTIELQYNLYGFFVGTRISQRPNLEIFDEDETAAFHSPEWLRGGSTHGDGLVVDPSRQYGYVNEIVNHTLQNFLQPTSGLSSYEYAPRQKLPRVIWTAFLGYSFQI